MRSKISIMLIMAMLLSASLRGVQAQLATSFYNVTKISYKVLPNAVQLTIQADGMVNFGLEGENLSDTSSIKLRMLGARTSIPSYVNIGAYPVDSVNIYPAQDTLKQPININNDSPTDPKVDVVIRFYVPVSVGSMAISDYDYQAPTVLLQRQVKIERGADRRSIVVTVITDRTDFQGAAKLKRSPPEQQNHHLNIVPVENNIDKQCADGSAKNGPYYKVDALHTSLKELVANLTRMYPDYPLNVSDDASDIDISMHLPNANLKDLVDILKHGYALNAVEDKEHGGVIIGRNIASESSSIPLKYLKPENARLMFPDFLLPSIHVDSEHNALIVSGIPLIIDKIGKDISQLDIPSPTVLMEAHVYEFTTDTDASQFWQATRSVSRDSESVDTLLGQTSLVIQKGQTNKISAKLEALRSRGRVRLVASPSLKLVSETSGELFLGQQRYVTVLKNDYYGTSVNAIPVSIGTKVNMWARATGNDILVFINPSISTVDSIEQGTGLPTIGIRECQSALHVQSGDTIIVAGMDSISDDQTRRHISPFNKIPLIGGLFRSGSKGVSKRSIILLLSAKVLS